ncbi:transporter substrate-binding domain-containing protein [Priestia abyssalis]|uniref:transporter substrate-binding domain-containing protein n=1 Tax=Priestia abyssalis TaxID=1221450 RepID=UPI0009956E11|nr:transporter substrate-binding domain-containing protein [Priestia abyssalis]
MRRVWRAIPVIILSFFICLFSTYSAEGSTNERKKVYRIAGDRYLPPFSYVNEDGKFTGFSVELFERIAKQENVAFEFIPMASYKAIEALKKGEIDAVMGMKYSSRLSGQFLFSESYFMVTDTVVLPKKDASSVRTLTDLREKIVVIQEDPTALSLIMNIRDAEVTTALNTRDAFAHLMANRADALLTNKWTAAHYIKQNNIDSQYEMVDGLTGTSAEFTAIVHPNERQLLQIINTSIAEMKANGDYLELHSHWFSGITDQRLKELRNWIAALVILLILILVALSIIYLWNKKLKDEVRKRTAALEFVNRKLKDQQIELSQADQFKENILNHIYSGLITFDNENNLTSINRRARTILNLAGEGPIGVEDILSLPKMKQVLAAYEESAAAAAKESEVIFSEELSFEDDSGKHRSILFRIIPLNGRDLRSEGYLITLADRSEERMLERKLALQEKMGALGQLVAGVAHEIRNPLTTLKMFVEMLPKKYENPEFRDEMLKYVPESVKRMNQIVEGLLGYSRRNEAKRDIFALTLCIQSIVSIMEPTLRKNAVKLVLDVDDRAYAFADQNQIGQILLNFMLNGLDAMADSQEKVMTVTAYSDDKYAYITVADTGCGIEPEALARLFEPFYTTKTTGIGLGLSLCYQWAEENNGGLDVKSLENGSEFTVKLPVKKGDV